MAKEKQKNSKRTKAKKLKCIHTPELPAIVLPEWMPEKLKVVLLSYVEEQQHWKNNEMRPQVDFWVDFVNACTRVLPAFTTDAMKPAWETLFAESEKSASDLVTYLFRINQSFETAKDRIKRNIEEKECAVKMVKEAEDFHCAMWDYQHLGYKHIWHVKHIELMKMLEAFMQDSRVQLENFESNVAKTMQDFYQRWPSTREVHSEEAEARYYVKKLFQFFESEYGKADYRIIADFISVMYKTNFTENQIIKLTRGLSR